MGEKIVISSLEPPAVSKSWRENPSNWAPEADEAPNVATLADDPSEYRFSYESRGGSIVLIVQRNDGSPPPPEWFESAFHKLAGLLDLSPNWDSYGAPEVDDSVVEL